MSTPCPYTIRVARAVRRRVWIVSVLRRAGLGLAVGAGLGLILILALRLGLLGRIGLGSLEAVVRQVPWWQGWWWGLLGALGLGGLAGALVGSVLGVCSLGRAAGRIDQSLGLKDRLGSALSFASDQTRKQSPAAELAIRDAERVASAIKPAQVVPLVSVIGNGRIWWAACVLLVGAVAVGFWMPQTQSVQTAAEHGQLAQLEREAAADRVASAAMATRKEMQDQRVDPAEQKELDAQLAELAQIERELRDESAQPQEALARSAQTLAKTADTLKESAQQKERTDEALARELAQRLKPLNATLQGDTPAEHDATDALFDALARDDLSSAQQAVDALEKALPEMDATERARAAAKLQELARQLSAQQEQSPAQASDEMDKLLGEQGVEDPKAFEDMTDAQEMARELQKQGVPKDAADRLSEQLAKENRQRHARTQAQQDIEDLHNATNAAADQLTPDAQPPEPESKPEPEPEVEPATQPEQPKSALDDQAEKNEHNEDNENTQAPKANPKEQRKQAEEPKQSEQSEHMKQSDSHNGTEKSASENKKKSSKSSKQTTQSTQKPSQNQQNQQSQHKEKKTGSKKGQPQPQPQSQSQSKEGKSQPDPESKSQSPTKKQSQRTTPDADKQSPDDPKGSPRSLEQLRKQLQRMADRTGKAQKQRQASEKLKEQARKLLEEASPEERKKLEKLAREFAKNGKQGNPPSENPSEKSGEKPGDRWADTAGQAAKPKDTQTGQGTGPTRDGHEQRAPGAENKPWQIEPFDARGRSARNNKSGAGNGQGQVIADWLDPNKDDAISPGAKNIGKAGLGADSSQGLQQAFERASSATDQQAIPRARRDLVRRVFERYQKRARESAKKNSSGEAVNTPASKSSSDQKEANDTKPDKK